MNGMKLEKSYFIAKEKKEDKEKTKFYGKKLLKVFLHFLMEWFEDFYVKLQFKGDFSYKTL